MQFGGEGPSFWGAVLVTLLVKFLLSDKTSAQRSIGGTLAGLLVGYFGHDFVIRLAPFFTPEDDVIVAILLALTGEQIMRFLMSVTPSKALKMWRGE